MTAMTSGHICFQPSPSVDMMFMTKLCRAVSKVRLLYAVICKTRG